MHGVERPGIMSDPSSTTITPRRRPSRTLLHLDDDVRQRLEASAAKHRRTLSAEASVAILRHADEPRLSDGETQAAA